MHIDNMVSPQNFYPRMPMQYNHESFDLALYGMSFHSNSEEAKISSAREWMVKMNVEMS